MAVTHPRNAVQVQFLPDALTTGPFVYRFRTPVFKPARGVRFPYGLLHLTGWWNRQTRGPQKAVPTGREGSTPSLVTGWKT